MQLSAWGVVKIGSDSGGFLVRRGIPLYASPCGALLLLENCRIIKVPYGNIIVC